MTHVPEGAIWADAVAVPIGEPANTVGPSTTGYREEATIVDIPKRNAERAAAQAKAKAKARSRWKIAGAVAKAVVSMPMGAPAPCSTPPLLPLPPQRWPA